MKIYRPESKGKNFSLFLQPGREHPENSEWVEADGSPRSFTVQFIDGVADLDKGLAQYILDKKLAQKSPLILPSKEIVK